MSTSLGASNDNQIGDTVSLISIELLKQGYALSLILLSFHNLPLSGSEKTGDNIEKCTYL